MENMGVSPIYSVVCVELAYSSLQTKNRPCAGGLLFSKEVTYEVVDLYESNCCKLPFLLGLLATITY